MSEKSPVIIDLKFDPETVTRVLKGAFADREVLNMADPAVRKRDLSGVSYAVLWNPDADLFSRAPDLKVLFSGGAGVDRILSLPSLPDIPIVRFVDHTLTTRMSEWVVLQCLWHLRQGDRYARAQQAHHWEELDQPQASDLTVGVMGLGVLGQDAVRKLKVMGFDVIGWSRTQKSIDGIETFDAAGLDSFLSRSDILVGLLPLTPETTGFYNAALFSKLRQGGALGRPVFINAGRGRSQNEADLARALQEGVLGGASLDVFEQEPLDAASPFWDMENVVVTPHAAAASDTRALFRNVEAQIARFERGEALEHLVDRSRGY